MGSYWIPLRPIGVLILSLQARTSSVGLWRNVWKTLVITLYPVNRNRPILAWVQKIILDSRFLPDSHGARGSVCRAARDNRYWLENFICDFRHTRWFGGKTNILNNILQLRNKKTRKNMNFWKYIRLLKWLYEQVLVLKQVLRRCLVINITVNILWPCADLALRKKNTGSVNLKFGLCFVHLFVFFVSEAQRSSAKLVNAIHFRGLK